MGFSAESMIGIAGHRVPVPLARVSESEGWGTESTSRVSVGASDAPAGEKIPSLTARTMGHPATGEHKAVRP